MAKPSAKRITAAVKIFSKDIYGPSVSTHDNDLGEAATQAAQTFVKMTTELMVRAHLEDFLSVNAIAEREGVELESGWLVDKFQGLHEKDPVKSVRIVPWDAVLAPLKQDLRDVRTGANDVDNVRVLHRLRDQLSHVLELLGEAIKAVEDRG